MPLKGAKGLARDRAPVAAMVRQALAEPASLARRLILGSALAEPPPAARNRRRVVSLHTPSAADENATRENTRARDGRP